MLNKLIRIAQDAGEMIRCAHDISEDITEKSSPIDVVTKYDTAVQAHLYRKLKELMPEAGFLGEEGDHEELTTEWTFIVDPIDGTANFVRNFAHSVISIALAKNGVSEYGVVYNPFRGEMFAAQRGCGATPLLSGRQCGFIAIHADKASALCQAAGDLQRVAGAAQRAVQIDAVRSNGQSLQTLVQTNRFMLKFHVYYS